MGALATYATDAAIVIAVKGSQPYGCFAHSFGVMNKPESFFNPKLYKGVKLKATNGGAGGVGAVILQQLRK